MIRRKYFKKVFLIFFTFTLVYGVILTSSFVYQNKVNLELQEINYSISASEQTVKNIDQRIWSLGKYTDTLFLDDSFTDYLITEDDYYVISNVYDKLRTDMAVFSDMGAKIAVTKVEDDLVISNQFTRNIDLFFEEMAFSDDIINRIYTFYEKEGNFRESLILHDPTYTQIHIVKKRKVNNKDYLILLMSLDVNVLQMGKNEMNFEIYIDGRDDEIGRIAKEILADKNDYIIEGDYLYLLRQSEIYPEIYYVVYQQHPTKIEVKDQLTMAIILFLVVTLLGFLVTLVVTRNIYRPLNKVMSQFEDKGSDTRDEFAFINRMTNEIINANDDLQVTIVEHKIDLKTKFLRELIYGLVPEAKIKEGVDNFNLQGFLSSCRVVIIELRELESYQSDYLNEAREKIRKNVYTILNTRLELEDSLFELVEMNYNTYALVIGKWEIKALRESLGRVLIAVEGNEQVELVMSIGREVLDCSQLDKSFEYANRIVDYRQSYDKRAILTMDDVVVDNHKEQFHYTLDIERELFNATISGTVEKIELIFERIKVSNFVDRNLNDQEKLSLIRALMTTLQRIEQKMSLEELSLYKIAFEEIIRSSESTIERLMEELLRVYIIYAKVGKEKLASKDDEISTLMISYIHEHYHEDISLEEAASFLNISAGYFCTIFKKQTGSNFKNYLNRYRVKMAIEIIAKEPDIKIKDLTLRLGYSNVNSFIRMFKKYEGVSPGEFAKENKIGNIKK